MWSRAPSASSDAKLAALGHRGGLGIEIGIAQVRGRPEPQVSWFRDRDSIFASAGCRVERHEGGWQSLTIQAPLTPLPLPLWLREGALQETSTLDAGTYICRATNALGSAVSSTILRVRPAALPDDEPQYTVQVPPSTASFWGPTGMKPQEYVDVMSTDLLSDAVHDTVDVEETYVREERDFVRVPAVRTSAPLIT